MPIKNNFSPHSSYKDLSSPSQNSSSIDNLHLLFEKNCDFTDRTPPEYHAPHSPTLVQNRKEEPVTSSNSETFSSNSFFQMNCEESQILYSLETFNIQHIYQIIENRKKLPHEEGKSMNLSSLINLLCKKKYREFELFLHLLLKKNVLDSSGLAVINQIKAEEEIS
jgi:hypothetical protein